MGLHNNSRRVSSSSTQDFIFFHLWIELLGMLHLKGRMYKSGISPMLQNPQQDSHSVPPDPHLGPFCPPDLLSLISLLPLRDPVNLDPSPIAILGIFLLDKKLLTCVFLPFLFLSLLWLGVADRIFLFLCNPKLPPFQFMQSRTGSAKHCWKISCAFSLSFSWVVFLSLLFWTEKKGFPVLFVLPLSL